MRAENKNVAEKAIIFYLWGDKLKSIAAQIGCSERGVKYILKRHNLPHRGRKDPLCLAKRLLQLKKEGKTDEEISSEMGIGQYYVTSFFSS